MTRDKKRKQATRARMTRTGEHYQAAHRALHPPLTATTEPAQDLLRTGQPWTIKTEGANLPKGWMIASRPDTHEIEMEPAAYFGKPAVHLWSSSNDSIVILSQVVHADLYRGKRVRLSGALRCHEASGEVMLLLRIDDLNRRTMAIDNMHDRPLGGTRDWSTQALVLDVDEHQSLRITFGLIFRGPGHVWLADLRFEIVGPDVPTTAQPMMPMLDRPVNLDFGE